jgi:hypothetical protein
MKMVFYSILFVASVIVALVVLYLYHMLADVGKTVYKAFLPSTKDSSSNHQTKVKVATSINDTPTPWGWQGKAAQESRKRTSPVASPKNVPWGWKGNNHEIRDRGSKPPVQTAVRIGAKGLDALLKQSGNGSNSDSASRKKVGWPYREEKTEFAGKAYTVKRKATPARTNLRTAGKPWGW